MGTGINVVGMEAESESLPRSRLQLLVKSLVVHKKSQQTNKHVNYEKCTNKAA